MSIAYDPALVETVGHILDLRAPNLAALDAIAKHLDSAPAGTEMVADLATGVGKTYVAGGLLDYLAESGIRNVVIITPGTTIQNKTVNNLTPGHPKYIRGLRCNPTVVTLDDLERGAVAAALEDDSVFKVFVFTVQSLLRPDTADARRAHRPHETLGIALYQYLQNAGDLVVIADEHHVYYSGNARKFQAAVDNLHPIALIGLTATPHEASEPKVIYRYPLAEAIADAFVKIPVLVARPDGMKDLRTQMADGVALLNAKTAAMNAYCAQTRQTPVQPILFVVAQTIDEASGLRDLLASREMFDGEEKVLLITSEEADKTLALLDTLEDVGSPIRAVVSVSMLKEGWDVKNIYVIAAVRAMESQLLTEQILGRGLRLPFGKRTGVPILDTVEVLSHHAFADLLKEANVLLEQTLGQRAEEASLIVNPFAGQNVEGLPIGQMNLAVQSGVLPTEVIVSLPGRPLATLDAQDQSEDYRTNLIEGEDESHVGMGFSTLDARLAEAREAYRTLTTILKPRSPGGIQIPLYLPKVTSRWERDAFSLAMLNEVDVESLGRTFVNDEGTALTRKALDATRDDTGHVEIVISDQTDAILASQALMPFATIEQDLAKHLLAANGVTSSVNEMNAATSVAEAFLKGALVTPGTPWRAFHGRLATARLVEWINTQQQARQAREIVEVTQIRWPDPPERIEAQSPADRHIVTSRAEFVPRYPYKGWERSVYGVNAFDAYSTEFRLATLFETTAGVKAWIRINDSVPLRIAYIQGSRQREYEPDFIVIDDAGIHWIVEGKSDSNMTDPAVLAKRSAAQAWVSTVNASPSITEKWGYLLASESVIAPASSWASLKAGAQTFR